jgi:hypothetical protein
LVTVSGALTVTVGAFAGSVPLTVTPLTAEAVGLVGASSPHALRMRADARTVADRAVVSRRDTGENFRSGGCQAARQLAFTITATHVNSRIIGWEKADRVA